MLNSVNDRLDEARQDQTIDGYVEAVVVDNVDPLGIGRIKVRVPNLIDPDLGAVPWIGQHRQSPFGQGQGFGCYGSPAIGAKVRIRLQNNDLNYCLAEADSYHTTDANPKFKDPNTWGFKDPSGNELFVNMTTKDWQFTHSSGTKLSYDSQGNLVLAVVKDLTETVGGNTKRTTNGTDDHHVIGNQTIRADANFTLTVKGSTSINSTGAVTVTTDANATITAGGAVNISGSTINLN